MRKLQEKNINTPGYWDRIYHEEILGRRSRIAIDRFQKVAALILPGSKVLDVGCGSGDFVRYLSENRPDCVVVACDFSTVAIDYIASKNKDITCRVVDIMKLSEFLKKDFDFVCTLETIEHVDDPQKLVDEMQAVTKNGGTIVITTPYDDKVTGGAEHMHAFAYTDMCELFKDESKYFITNLYRYSESYQNLFCIVKVV